MTKVKEQIGLKEMEKEWVELISEARKLGLSYDEIQKFLENEKASK
ncbi:DNA-binding anti-repressor SinI [Metabacillus halosaccharovorans]|nr:DNA-binding anti-repressor SinI [Metabacillus halosaccharovorans]MCM3442157.1 anti-repressor SinI family protein [Metabacillus halosaccharovorans]